MRKSKEQKPEDTVKLACPNRQRCRRWVLLVTILVLVAAAVLSWLRQQRLSEEEAKVREMLKAMAAGPGGQYHEEVQGPKWYVKLVEKFNLPVPKRPSMLVSRAVTDEDMKVVGRARTLVVVKLSCSKVSDTGLAHLEGLTKLRELHLISADIGDAGLEHLSKLTELIELRLSHIDEISDEGLAHLKGLTKLQGLHLQDIDIGDTGLAHLSQLTELRRLYLSVTKVGDEGLAHVKKLKNLRHLDLRETEVTDDGLAHLSGLVNLSYLELGKTQVTDAGLVHLKSLKGLRSLGLLKTLVTPDGIADLWSAIPHVAVTADRKPTRPSR